MNKTFKDKIIKLFKNDTRLWSMEKEELNQTLLKDLIDKFDEKVIEVLLGDPETKKQFFVKVKDAYIFKPNDFKFFLDENKIDNSYTQLANKIGLTTEEFSSEKVILSWPFKDCVLEGGMTKEDEVDVYFKYNKESGEWTEEKAKRKEIFFNEVLARDEIDRLEEPKAFSKWERFTFKGGEKVKEIKRDENGLIKENFVIKGNNLLALHSLKEQFEGKIKLVYIDPPYNRDADAFYNDNFNHSTWLTFMQNRLEVASDLLHDSGLIFVQIDDVEYGYLKVLMDQIFDRTNYITTITVKSKTPSGVGQESVIFDITERIIVFSKNNEKTQSNNIRIFDEIVDENSKTVGNYNMILESYGKEKFVKELQTGKGKPVKVYSLENFKYSKNPKSKCTKEWAYKNYDKIFRLSPANGGLMKRLTPLLPDGACCIEYTPEKGKYANKQIKVYFLDKDMVVMLSQTSIKNDKEQHIEKMVNVHNNWTEESLWQGIANEGGVKLKNGKKPEALLKRILDIATNKNDIVLDYHAGSGTTCAVAHKMGRQWIGIEQLDYSENNPEERMKGVIAGDKTGISKETNWKGGGDFIYIQLAKWNEEAKEKITETKSYDELVKLFSSLYEKYFLNYNVKAKDFKETIIKSEEFKKLSLIEQKKMFVRMLDLNQMYINFSERNDKKYNLSKDDIALSEKFYDEK